MPQPRNRDDEPEAHCEDRQDNVQRQFPCELRPRRVEIMEYFLIVEHLDVVYSQRVNDLCLWNVRLTVRGRTYTVRCWPVCVPFRVLNAYL